jgi:hypothetical protein
MKFRFLTPHYLDRLYDAGETADLPSDFVPGGGMEPLDDAALLAFWRAGPQSIPYVFNGLRVSPPKTFWKSAPIPGSNLRRYSLSGLGERFGDDIVGA